MTRGRAVTIITRRLQGDECPWQREHPPSAGYPLQTE
jgi:hypothetical protein